MATKIVKRSTNEPTLAQNAVEIAVSNFCWIRDMLGEIEQAKGDNLCGMPPDEFAFFVRAGLEVRLEELERALVAAGALMPGTNMFTDTRAIRVLRQVRHG